MGLDITAYGNLVLAEAKPRGDDYNAWGDSRVDAGTHVWVNEGWSPPRIGPLVDGLYFIDQDRRLSFRAGSYSGYNGWRNWLETIAAGTDAFYELINFSDAEGFLGPAVSAKLAEDFKQNRGNAILKMSDEWDLEKYDQWQGAFALAANNGVVEFH